MKFIDLIVIRAFNSSLCAVLLATASCAAQETLPAGPRILGDVDSPGATVRGAVVVGRNGTSVISGSQIQSGETNAEVKLRRGGSIQVCKRSSITLTSAGDGREMLIALNQGAVELEYALPSTSDTVITPDFRLMLTGPGTFHFAIGSAPNGGMCVRSLQGNTSSAIVNEQFGDGAHQVKASEQITFRNGHVDDSSQDAADCGCTKPLATVAPASQPQPTPPALGFPEQQSRSAEAAVAAGNPPPKAPGLAIQNPQPATTAQTYAQIDAPMVFRAEDLPPPAPSVALAKLPHLPVAAMALPQPRPTPRASEKKAWYQRFGHALASFFGGNSPHNNAQQ